MKENKILEKNQSIVYNDIAAKYRVKAVYQGIEYDEFADLDALKSGIRLHFLRYGLFDYNDDNANTETIVAPEFDTSANKAIIVKDGAAKELIVQNQENYSSEDEKAIQLSVVELLSIKKIPKLENFYVARTALHAGYVYLINDEDPINDHLELEIDDFGFLSIVKWENNKNGQGEYLDVRKSDSKTKEYIIVPPDKKYRVAFSPIQWKIDYHEKVCTDSNLRCERMELVVESKGFERKGTSDNIDIQPFNAINATFETVTPASASLQQQLNLIAKTEKKEDEIGGNETLEDLFITLHDPFSCAGEICMGIDSEVTRLKAIMVSLQTGKSVDSIFPLLQKGVKIPADNSEKGKQINYLHRLAQLTYDFVYNNNENTEKYNSSLIQSDLANVALDLTVGFYIRQFIEQNGVDKNKLEKLLAVVERASQRDIINLYRDDLGNLMKSDYYQDASEEFLNGIADGIESAKETISIHKIALGNYPNIHDRHLDLREVYKLKEDNWYKHINETLYNENPSIFAKSTQILDYQIDIQDVKVLDLTKKTASTIDKIVKAYANHEVYVGAFATLKQKTLPITGKVSYFRDKTTRVATFKFKALENFDKYISKYNLRLEINGETVTMQQFKKYWHLEYKKMTQKSTEALIKDGKLEVNLKGNFPKRFKTEAEKLLKSNAFGGVVVVIEALVWTKAINEFSKDQTFKNFEKLSFASVKLGAATFSLIEKMKLYDKYLVTKGIEKNILIKRVDKFRIKVGALKIASSAITIFTASRDSYINFSVRDNDAATLYGMAAGIGAVFLAADVSALIGGSAAIFAIGFWPAALLGGALIGCYYIAQKYFEDTQLEAYFKNFPLSDFALPPKTNELPSTYINRLVKHNTDTVIDPWFESAKAKEYKSFSNFEKAYVAFLDIAIPSAIIVEPDAEEFTNYRRGFDKHNVITNRFKASIYSAQKINDFDDLDIKAWFYPRGIKAPLKEGHRAEITSFMYQFPDIRYNFDKNKIIPNCVVTFGLPQKFYWQYRDYPDGEILFTVRLKIDNDEFTPTNFNESSRYLFGNAQLHNHIDNDIKHMSSIFTAHRYKQRVAVRNVKLQNVTQQEAAGKQKIVAEESITLLQSYRTK